MIKQPSSPSCAPRGGRLEIAVCPRDLARHENLRPSAVQRYTQGVTTSRPQRWSAIALCLLLAACTQRDAPVPEGERVGEGESAAVARVDTDRRFSWRGVASRCREADGRPPPKSGASAPPAGSDERWIEEPCPRGTAVARCTSDDWVDFYYPGFERRSDASAGARARCRGVFEALPLTSCESRAREYFTAMSALTLGELETIEDPKVAEKLIARGQLVSGRAAEWREKNYLRRRAIEWELDEPTFDGARVTVRCLRYERGAE